ncbi:MAG TPA: hypothetical protein DCW29_09365, partial [Janthinobacterium sp.]|nr:hypothetical protein [Janthinobacterium sp.]
MAVAGHAHAEEKFGQYFNKRYGFTIDYPLLLIPQGVADNGDGQAFRSPSNDAELVVFAGACIESDNDTPAHYIANAKKEKKPDEVITYIAKGTDYAVVSGLHGHRIFYRKTIMKKDWCTEFEWEYPDTQRKTYDPMTTRIAASFKP